MAKLSKLPKLSGLFVGVSVGLCAMASAGCAVEVSEPTPDFTANELDDSEIDDEEAPPPLLDLPAGAEAVGDEACFAFSPTTNVAAPSVVFVLDQSGSMNTPWDHDADPSTYSISRWSSLWKVVYQITVDFEDRIDFGLKLFPSTGGGCEVAEGIDVPCAASNAEDVVLSIPGLGASISINNSTPTPAAIQAAGDYLVHLPNTQAEKAMILVMDGDVATECGYWNELRDGLKALHEEDGIPTYVVGIDISVGKKGTMDDYAEAGGRPREDAETLFYDVSNQVDLEEAMDAIIGDVLSCTLTLDELPGPLNTTGVDVDGMARPMVEDCDAEDGWTFSASGEEIQLCGTACADFLDSAEAEIKYYCPVG